MAGHRYGITGRQASEQIAGPALPDPPPWSAGTLDARAQSGRIWLRWRLVPGDPHNDPRARSFRSDPDPAPPAATTAIVRDTPAGCGHPGASAGMGGRGLSHPQEPTPHADGSLRAPARTGALRAAGVTNG